MILTSMILQKRDKNKTVKRHRQVRFTVMNLHTISFTLNLGRKIH